MRSAKDIYLAAAGSIDRWDFNRIVAVNIGTQSDEALNQFDIAGLDSGQKTFDGWRSRRRHTLSIRRE